MAINAIRKVKWHLAGMLVVALAIFAIGLVATQGENLAGIKFAVVYGAAFVATTAFFPLCYLTWFGGPNHPDVAFVFKIIFWVFVTLFSLFWLRVLMFALWR